MGLVCLSGERMLFGFLKGELDSVFRWVLKSVVCCYFYDVWIKL